jgi:hypothetical protein
VQVEKITRLNAEVIVAFDKDVTEEEILKECSKFMDCVDVYYIWDRDNLLQGKASPMDDGRLFQRLINNNKYSYVR